MNLESKKSLSFIERLFLALFFSCNYRHKGYRKIVKERPFS